MLESYQILFPHYPLALAAGDSAATITPIPPYHAFTVGTIRFIISDLRSEATDAHIYSDTQRQWLYNELTLAANYDFVIWLNSKPWIGEIEAGSDKWWGYSEDRKELSEWIAETVGSADGPQNLLAVSADAHMVAYDDGRNTFYGDVEDSETFISSFPILHPLACIEVEVNGHS